MVAVNYSQLRKSLKKNLDLACQEHETVVVQRSNEKSVVIISLEDYNSMVETAYLLGTKKNAQRLTDSIKQLDKREKLKKTDPTA